MLIFAPNWLGDAVMALPAIADVVAARGCRGSCRHCRAARRSRGSLRASRESTASSRSTARTGAGGSPGSTRTRGPRGPPRLTWRCCCRIPCARRSSHGAPASPGAGGTRHQGRGVLLTRAVAKPHGPVHQADYYRHLVRALGIANGPREPRLRIPPDAAAEATRSCSPRRAGRPARGWWASRPARPSAGRSDGCPRGSPR